MKVPATSKSPNCVPLVAFEGIDGVGKTATITALIRRCPRAASLLRIPPPYLKLRPYVDRVVDKHARFLYHLSSLRQALTTDPPDWATYRIIDRYLPSLFAYSNVFHGLTIDTFLRYMEPFWTVVPKESAAIVLTCRRRVLLRRLRRKRTLNAVERKILRDASVARRLDRALLLYRDKTSDFAEARWVFVDTSDLTPSGAADRITRLVTP